MASVGDLITGKLGAVSVGGTAIDITAWSIQKSATPLNGSDSSSGDWEEFAVGKRVDWKGTFEGFMKAGEDAPAFNTEAAFVGTADTGIFYNGQIIITEQSTPVDVNNSENVKVAFSFQGTGVLAFTDPTV